MTIKILHEDEIAEVLEVNGSSKLDLKIDDSGNVTLSKSAAGLKAEVALPEAFDPSELNGKVQTLEGKVQALETAPKVDVKLAGLSFEGGKLKGSLSDGSETETDFNAEVVIAALEGATSEQKNRLKAALIDALKGEEVQNLAGATKGYLLAA